MGVVDLAEALIPAYSHFWETVKLVLLAKRFQSMSLSITNQESMLDLPYRLLGKTPV